MKRILLLAPLLLLVCLIGEASAQRKMTGLNRPAGGRNPANQIRNDALFNRPTTSPYLNLLRPQSGMGVPNYQSLVRPQVQQNRINNQQRSAINNLQGDVRGMENAPPPYVGVRPTGHRSTFGETGGYFGGYP